MQFINIQNKSIQVHYNGEQDFVYFGMEHNNHIYYFQICSSVINHSIEFCLVAERIHSYDYFIVSDLLKAIEFLSFCNNYFSMSSKQEFYRWQASESYRSKITDYKKWNWIK